MLNRDMMPSALRAGDPMNLITSLSHNTDDGEHTSPKGAVNPKVSGGKDSPGNMTQVTLGTGLPERKERERSMSSMLGSFDNADKRRATRKDMMTSLRRERYPSMNYSISLIYALKS